MLRFLTGKKTTLRLKWSTLRPSWRLMAPVLALGVAPFVMQSTEALLNISFNSSLQRYGGDVAVGAMTIASTVMQIVWIPAQGLGQGAQPIISYNYGAHQPERVIRALHVALLTAGICGISVAVFLSVGAPDIISLFLDPREKAYALAVGRPAPSSPCVPSSSPSTSPSSATTRA